MVAQRVEAVWLWAYVGSAQKWTYGRYAADGFTKDNLQVPTAAGSLLSSVFDYAGRPKSTHDLNLRWVGGSTPGWISWSSNRYNLHWKSENRAPAPWRLTPSPTEAGPGVLPGTPDEAALADAQAALAAYNALGVDGYLVAVKLVDEPDVLHVRAYIGNPPTGQEYASTDLLPAPVKALTAQVGASQSCAAVHLASGSGELLPEVGELIAKLEENPNLLLVGPPGTGKTVLLEKLTRFIEDPGGGVYFDPDKNLDAWSEVEAEREPGKTGTVVLHPSYSYDNLVVGLLPTPGPGGGVAVKAATGPMVNLAHYAAATGHHAVLVLDEFNRGNAAAILGDTLALLDRDKRGRAHIDLPYSELAISVPAEFAEGGDTSVAGRFTLPPNLWIVAAMNSSDRSVAPLDAALRRRFSIVEIPPDYEALATKLVGAADADLTVPWTDWEPGTVGSLAVKLLRRINGRIASISGRDFELGQSNFWHVTGDTPQEALRALCRAWDRQIVQTLRLAFQDDDDALAVILAAGPSSGAEVNNTSQAAWWKLPEDGLGQYARSRLHFNDLSAFADEDLLAEFLRLAG